jgi:hypothetical protein
MVSPEGKTISRKVMGIYQQEISVTRKKAGISRQEIVTYRHGIAIKPERIAFSPEKMGTGLWEIGIYQW